MADIYYSMGIFDRKKAYYDQEYNTERFDPVYLHRLKCRSNNIRFEDEDVDYGDELHVPSSMWEEIEEQIKKSGSTFVINKYYAEKKEAERLEEERVKLEKLEKDKERVAYEISLNCVDDLTKITELDLEKIINGTYEDVISSLSEILSTINVATKGVEYRIETMMTKEDKDIFIKGLFEDKKGGFVTVIPKISDITVKIGRYLMKEKKEREEKKKREDEKKVDHSYHAETSDALCAKKEASRTQDICKQKSNDYCTEDAERSNDKIDTMEKLAIVNLSRLSKCLKILSEYM